MLTLQNDILMYLSFIYNGLSPSIGMTRCTFIIVIENLKYINDKMVDCYSYILWLPLEQCTRCELKYWLLSQHRWHTYHHKTEFANGYTISTSLRLVRHAKLDTFV